MNLYTFNFKIKTFLLLLSIVAIYIAFDVSCFLLDRYGRSYNEKYFYFANDAKGKKHLMRYLYPKSTPKIIFVGNSFTKEHVSTAIFHKNGIKIFNYGIEGYFIAQYPKMIENALKFHPKIIALSMQAPELYSPFSHFYVDYNHDSDIPLSNIFFLGSHSTGSESLLYALKLLMSYFKTLDYFATKGHIIQDHIKDTFWGKTKLFKFSPLPPLNLSLDCDFDMHAHPIPFRNCGNGDGVLIGKTDKTNMSFYREDKELDKNKLNYQFVEILNSIFAKIKQAGIKPMLILIPTFAHYKLDETMLSALIDADIINLSNLRLHTNAWHDYGHYNVRGRKEYTEALVKKFKLLLDNVNNR
ncbi:MAG: hypothetical protein K0R24_208 [Gammaproteobacteria bacterium]|jgi:hypothetical protein|nr:hypothetical protein [Gammaproteobacteria bacterium]